MRCGVCNKPVPQKEPDSYFKVVVRDKRSKRRLTRVEHRSCTILENGNPTRHPGNEQGLPLLPMRAREELFQKLLRIDGALPSGGGLCCTSLRYIEQ